MTSQRSRYDVVVVGGRVAGSATAMLLARLGHDVVVVDQAFFPSDTISTHSIARSGVVQLQRWGLLDAVLDSGTPAIRQVTFHALGESVSRTIKHKAGVGLVVSPRRYVLDTIGPVRLLRGHPVDRHRALRGRTVVRRSVPDPPRAGMHLGLHSSGEAQSGSRVDTN
jgi:glycine/D-amino acid oxidase-like deaminating enzyme